MLNLKKRMNLTAPVMAAAIGALLFVITYGVRILNPTYVGWLMQEGKDLSQHYFGWCFFRQSPWHFPLGLTSTLGYPQMTSVMFTDSIPLVAVFFKLLSPILPETFQYFGLWGIVCFMLNGAVGAMICMRFTDSKPRAVLGGTMFILSPIVLQRLYYHSALAGHWLIFLGIYLLVSHAALKDKFKSALLYWGILGALCASIHQYFLPMCGILCFGYALFELLKNKRIKGLLHCVVFIGAALAVDYLLGAFSVNAHTEASGLGTYSFNLNALFNPQGFSKVFPDLPTYNDQHEGFAYLGFGVIVAYLIDVVVRLYLREKQPPRKFGSLLRAYWKDALVYAFIIAACIGMALSPVVTLGDRVLFTMPLPETITNLWSVFRATGRLVWPVPYLIMVFGLAALLRREKKLPALIAIAFCVCCQLYDLSGVLKNRHENYSAVYVPESPITKSFWSQLGQSEKLEHLVISEKIADPWGSYLYPFAGVAVENHWTLNNFYFARSYDGVADTWKEALMAPTEDMVLVLSPEEHEIFAMSAAKEINFYEIDDVIVGLCDASLVSQKPMPRTSSGFAYVFGEGQNMQGGEDIDGVRYIYPDGLSYGPYVAVAPGIYQVEIRGSNLDLGDYDATANAGSHQLILHGRKVEPDRVRYRIQVLEPIVDLETRVFNNSENTMTIQSLTLTELEGEMEFYGDFDYTASFTDGANLMGGQDVGGVRQINPGGVSAGPHIQADAGVYEIEITGDGIATAEIDCVSEDGMNIFVPFDYSQKGDTITFRVKAVAPVEALEVQIHNDTPSQISVKSLRIRSVENLLD